MPVGYGEFSCCKLGHSWGGHSMTCDKKRIRGAMEEMLQAKVASFKGAGKAAEKSWYACMQQFFLKGLPDKEVSFSLFFKIKWLRSVRGIPDSDQLFPDEQEDVEKLWLGLLEA